MIDTRTYAIPLPPHPTRPQPLTVAKKLDISVKRGVEAGLLMGAYQWMLHLLHISDILPLQLLSLAYLALVLLRSIRKNKPKVGRIYFLRSALTLGSLISFFAALTLLLTKSLALTWSVNSGIPDQQLVDTLSRIAPQAGIVFITGCLVSLLFWRLFRYPEIDV